ncbi:uncharacterized protein MCYG_05748 [Microsporum canis CBS 113480]|uniref:F-box domain-containing protein n=1 Tax=Arthroderma otae (strain ATCC MYA-4605 / CBS 113480) TaxID=554155 RepID=C5FSS6_ARTOC|nr:uncharacterized protein MCYG_05748 [Microsporum canis CBS 113480]EEQ32929.1 predicted protein [Microsporum canis CBS 113480]
MPTEVIEMVAGFLEYKSLCSLRLTCKLFYEGTLHCFGAFLATVSIDFSSSSLQKLKAISDHQYLNRYVQCLSIVNEAHGKLGLDLRWDRAPSGYLIVPQRPVEILRDTLALLINCRSFEVHHVYLLEHQYTSNFLGGSDAIRILLYTISETALPVKSLTFERGVARGWRSDSRINGERLNVQDLRNPGLLAGLSHLQSLTLNYQKELESSIDWTCELIRVAANLARLTARFNGYQSTPLLFDRLSSTTLPPVQELVLESCELSSLEVFIAFLRHFHSSLRILSLTRIRLSTNGWFLILQKLRGLFPFLSSIKLNHLRGDKRPDTLISFPDIHKHKTISGEVKPGFSYYYKTWRGKRSLVGVRYNGSDMGTALRIVASSARAC